MKQYFLPELLSKQSNIFTKLFSAISRACLHMELLLLSPLQLPTIWIVINSSSRLSLTLWRMIQNEIKPLLSYEIFKILVERWRYQNRFGVNLDMFWAIQYGKCKMHWKRAFRAVYIFFRSIWSIWFKSCSSPKNYLRSEISIGVVP